MESDLDKAKRMIREHYDGTRELTEEQLNDCFEFLESHDLNDHTSRTYRLPSGTN